MSLSAVDAAVIDFRTHPDRYRHWDLRVEGSVAVLTLQVAEEAPLRPGYVLKRNSYDLGVDIELADAIQRLRFEHPEVGCVVITSGDSEVFSAGANIQMLATASHAHKVNFCKFTNETRITMEDATARSRQIYLCAMNGPASGGGYELALACDHLILVDDGNAAVALPELPLLAVLPGTGGLTRLVDKRRVRRDRADVLCTLSEGIRGRRALEWGLVDELAPRSRFMPTAMQRAAELADSRGDSPAAGAGIELPDLARELGPDSIRYAQLQVRLDRALGVAEFEIRGPEAAQPDSPAAIAAAGAAFWPLAFAREMDDAILHLRLNEPTLGVWVIRTIGDPAAVAAVDATLARGADDWLVREITLYLRRTLTRLVHSARSILALIEPGSCFTGTLLELALAADRSYMLEGPGIEGEEAARIRLTPMNFGPLTMSNGWTRLQTRFADDADALSGLQESVDVDLDANAAEDLGLVTFAPDAIDWAEEIRLALEERAAFSPDALTGMEANLRFPGPETMETKIFARLSAWQNWIFMRSNAVGAEGALQRYGSGQQPQYQRERT